MTTRHGWLREMVEQTNRTAKIGGWEYDLEQEKMIWTSETYKIHNMPPEYMPKGKESLAFYHAASQLIIRKAFKSLIKKGKKFELDLQLNPFEKNTIWVRTTGKAKKKAGKIVTIFGTIQDITEQKEKEIELNFSRMLAEDTATKLRNILDNSTEAIILISPDLNVLEINQPAKIYIKQICGKSPVQGDPIVDYIPADNIYDFKNSIANCLSGEQIKLDYKAKFKNRKSKWFELIYAPVLNKNKQIIAVYFSAHNIQDRKEELETYRITQDSFKNMIENAPVPVLVHVDLKVVYANPAAASTFEADSFEDLIGLNVLQFIHPDSMEFVKQRIDKMYRNEADARLVQEKLLTLKGNIIEARVYGTRFHFMGKTSSLVMFFNKELNSLSIKK